MLSTMPVLKVQGRGSNPPKAPIENAILHSFLIAARNLIPFLYFPRERSNDLRAEDFFDDGATWHQKRPASPYDVRELFTLISQRLAHLTWDRFNEKKLAWDWLSIAFPIAEALEAFVSHAPSATIDQRLKKESRHLMTLLRRLREKKGGSNAPLGPPYRLLDSL